ncbi:iron-sulfur cluster biosynthesis protein [Bombilactobacillus folatiphilus]|uniref:Iron-sulfur cluster biosynthesis protein n=1 Tax=Bombilactobacillus folatiphilus TaxID=2923362 RepID=A0ABY4PAA2_9LACO|nr:iron-sulfur cluster biosynthesis protein [Bombilactobacillus folatiphilus]UQS82559.1 iron-sulfur cluster biosynthesis protein [Bombilactobacillus folatiphilus]
MKFTISPQAQTWYRENLDLRPGDGLHFYGKVYGKTNVHDGFSLAFLIEKPRNPYYELQIDDISYFFTDNDVWFFKYYDLQIDYDAKSDSPIYTFVPEA